MAEIDLLVNDYEIPAGLHLLPMRHSIETWDTVDTDWSIIYGTGETEEIIIGDSVYHVYITAVLPCNVSKARALFSTGDGNNPIEWRETPELWTPHIDSNCTYMYYRIQIFNKDSFDSYGYYFYVKDGDVFVHTNDFIQGRTVYYVRYYYDISNSMDGYYSAQSNWATQKRFDGEILGGEKIILSSIDGNGVLYLQAEWTEHTYIDRPGQEPIPATVTKTSMLAEQCHYVELFYYSDGTVYYRAYRNTGTEVVCGSVASSKKIIVTSKLMRYYGIINSESDYKDVKWWYGDLYIYSGDHYTKTTSYAGAQAYYYVEEINALRDKEIEYHATDESTARMIEYSVWYF